MPELPEVETICRGLTPHLVGQSVRRLVLYRADLRFAFPPHMAAQIEGAKIIRLARRAKFICTYLDNGQVWLTHLGMTGRYTIWPKGAAAGAERHRHLEATLDNGARLSYSDPRRFGYMDLVAADALAECRHFKHLGVEPLGRDFNGAVLRAGFAGRKTPVKNALLNQNIVAGLGNIYVCEALFRAGIAPKRAAGRVGAAKCTALVRHIRAVLKAAIQAGGSSLRDFAGAEGHAGYFQHQFDVYHRAGEACTKRGCRGRIKRIVQSGRASFFCPSCQK